MSEDRKAGRILVASDGNSDAGPLRRLLAQEFESVDVSTQVEAAVADFERVRPDVIVLAFDSLQKSQQYCLGLLRFSKFAQTHPHRVVILCSNDDVAAVFRLCKKDYFDDYVPYWPQPHDGHRLVMAVWNALRRLAAMREPEPGRAEIVAHAQGARTLGTLVDHQLHEGINRVAAAQASLADAEREAAAASAHENITRALATSRNSLAPVAEWAKGLRAEVAPHVAAAIAFAGKLESARPVVLVVEDDAFAAKLIGKALEQATFSLQFAESAPAVLDLLRGTLPALILMDINLPGMDGLALTEWLKASPTLAHIPVIMLTSEATRETIARSKAVGAVDFIVKPFVREALLAKVSRHLA